jgi:acetyl esterase
MRSVLDRMARAARAPMHAMTAQQARAFYEQGSGVLDLPPHKMARTETLSLPTRDGAQLHARLWVPHLPQTHLNASQSQDGGANGLPVLLYLHGGVFTIFFFPFHQNFFVVNRIYLSSTIIGLNR